MHLSSEILYRTALPVNINRICNERPRYDKQTRSIFREKELSIKTKLTKKKIDFISKRNLLNQR